MNHLIIPLNSKKKSATNKYLVGGKAANLVKLNQLGFPTAPGFIITTAVFHQIIRQSGLSIPAVLEELDTSAYNSLKDHIVSSPFDLRFENKIRKHHQKFDGMAAVRSSMVGEDQASTSFAGQLDTFLNIQDEQLIDAVRKCYASLFKPQLHKYISGRQISLISENADLLSMAVVVQQMVRAKYSGIAFTADPICGRREVIIEASEGTGEAIVSGMTNPDRYIVNANGKISEMIPVKNDQPMLSHKQILFLAESANQIARHLEFPQDVEWAWDGTDFIFLQTRPISTLVGKDIYSSKLMADMSPGLVKPLQWSTNTLAMSTHVFGRLFTKIIGPNDIDFAKSIRLIHSRVYANLTFFEELFQKIGLPGNFFEMIARDEKGRRHRPKLNFRMLPIILFRFLPFIWKYARITNQMNTFVTKQDNALDAFRKSDWTGIGTTEKFKRLKKLMQLHNDAQWSIIVTALNMTIRNTLLKKMIRKHAPSVEPSDLIKGLSGLEGLEPNKELDKLSQDLRPLGETLIRLCLQEEDQKIRQQLSSSTEGKRLINKFDAFMSKFGHLSANTTNFTETSWIENPNLIWSLVGSGALKKKQNHNENTEITRAARKNEVLKHLNLPQRLIFKRLLNSTITYMTLRERLSLLLSDDTYQFRRLILSLADDLVRKGILTKRDDIFYLFYDELESIHKDGPPSNKISTKVKQRRWQMEQDAQIIPDDTICGDQIINRPQLKSSTSEFLTGICGSSGMKQGYAYVVENPNSVEKTLTAEDILVVPFTHVGWTPLFSSIGGIIAETGGQLSHTAIVAREYGIPAIVNVRQAMQTIKTGQPLTIDADTGRIYLKHLDSIKGD